MTRETAFNQHFLPAVAHQMVHMAAEFSNLASRIVCVGAYSEACMPMCEALYAQAELICARLPVEPKRRGWVLWPSVAFKSGKRSLLRKQPASLEADVILALCPAVPASDVDRFFEGLRYHLRVDGVAVVATLDAKASTYFDAAWPAALEDIATVQAIKAAFQHMPFQDTEIASESCADLLQDKVPGSLYLLAGVMMAGLTDARGEHQLEEDAAAAGVIPNDAKADAMHDASDEAVGEGSVLEEEAEETAEEADEGAEGGAETAAEAAEDEAEQDDGGEADDESEAETEGEADTDADVEEEERSEGGDDTSDDEDDEEAEADEASDEDEAGDEQALEADEADDAPDEVHQAAHTAHDEGEVHHTAHQMDAEAAHAHQALASHPEAVAMRQHLQMLKAHADALEKNLAQQSYRTARAHQSQREAVKAVDDGVGYTSAIEKENKKIHQIKGQESQSEPPGQGDGQDNDPSDDEDVSWMRER